MFFSSKKPAFSPSDITGPLEKMSFDTLVLPTINNIAQTEILNQSYKESWSVEQ